jgi:flavin-dependent dehydrogenase
MTVRATARGSARGSLDGLTADVLICGASFAGLAVARELAGTGADVLLVDRYEIGERATSACATPTQWLDALGLRDAIRRELPGMTFTTPYGSVRYRLPWSWAAFDYRSLCELLFTQSDARFQTAVVAGRAASGEADRELIGVRTDRGVLRARLVVDALGWRRVLGEQGFQPPDAPLSRGLEVHPGSDGGEDLDVWVERSLVRRGYGWRVPAAGEARVGVASYAPADRVRRPTEDLARRLGVDAVGYQGNWFPHRLRPATEGGAFFVGDSAGHCFPLSGEGIRTAFYFGIACGRELAAVQAGERTRAQALARYGAFSARHRRAFAIAAALQRLVPALPPRMLSAGLRAIGTQRIVDRAFGWYLDQAHPAFAAAGRSGVDGHQHDGHDDDRLDRKARDRERPVAL